MKQTPNFDSMFHSKEITESKQLFLHYQLQNIYIVKEDAPFLINLHRGHGKTTSQVITETKIVHRSLLRFESKPSMFITFHQMGFLLMFCPKRLKGSIRS